MLISIAMRSELVLLRSTARRQIRQQLRGRNHALLPPLAAHLRTLPCMGFNLTNRRSLGTAAAASVASHGLDHRSGGGVATAQQQQRVLEVRNLKCGGCVANAEKILRSLPQVCLRT